MTETTASTTTSAPSTTGSSIAAGRGGGSGRSTSGRSGRGRGAPRSGRNPGRGDPNHHSSTQGPSTKASLFKGNTKDMNGHVFQIHGERTDPQQFDKTLEALSEYAMKSLKYPGDLVPFFKDLNVPVIPPVADLPPDVTSAFAKRTWENEADDWFSRTKLVKQHLKTLYSVAWGQCSEAMKTKLQTHDDFTSKDLLADCAWLLKEIKAITFQFEGQRYLFLSLDDAHSDLCAYRQGATETLIAYHNTFKNKIDVLEHYGGNYGTDDGLIQAASTLATAPSRPSALKRFTRNRSVALAFLKRADPVRFGLLWIELENNYARGKDEYPADLTVAYNLLNNYKKPIPVTAAAAAAAAAATSSSSNTPRADRPTPVVTVTPPAPTPATASADSVSKLGMTFAQVVAGANGVVSNNITCFRCEAAGHYANNCPNQTGVQLLQHETAPPAAVTDHFNDFSFAQHGFHPIPNTWVLLDSESTVSVFNNARLLHNIRPSATTVTVHTNGGTQVSSYIGDIPNFGPVWFNPQSLANILSLAAVRKVCRVTMDSAVNPSFHVHKLDGSTMIFNEFTSGLYYHDTAKNPTTNSTATAYTLLNTVVGNKTLFTRREIEGADNARKLYQQLGRPSEVFFQKILSQRMILNCPVTADDAKRALFIYGPDLATLKGKTTRQNGEHIPSITPLPLPDYIRDHHKNVTLCIDVFFVQGHRFFHTISRSIKFRTVNPVVSLTKATLIENTMAVINAHRQRGFAVTNIHADGAFECMREAVAPTILNINAADEHVGEVERSIRTIKERVRAALHALPYKRLPKEMIKGVVRLAVKALNQFPAEDGISDVLSPVTIVTGLPAPDYNHIQLDFGEYVTVFEDNNPTNTTAPRVVDAIALHHTGNAQGGYFFMSLATGERVSRRQYTKLPLTQRIIDAVEHLALQQHQPPLPGAGPVFMWHPEGLVLYDEQDAGNVVPPPEPAHELADGEPVNNAPDVIFEPDIPPIAMGEPVAPPAEVPAPPQPEGNQGAGVIEPDYDEDPVEGQFNGDDSSSAMTGATVASEGEEEDTDTPAHGHNLRTNRTRDYGHRFGHHQPDGQQFLQQSANHADAMSPERLVPDARSIFGYIFNQMSATVGIRKHGQAAVDALFKEFAQLDDKDVFEPVQAHTLTKSQKAAALRAINLIKEKRSGELKGRACADGRPQRSLYTKDETASPTIATDALMITLMVDAAERRDVATADVVGAYLHALMPDYVLMKLVGDAVDIMCSVNPRYNEFVAIEHGKKVLYLRLLKALYGCVKSALLWYDLFTGKLKERGFTLNPYDPCVANSDIEGSQCTVCWYVDDTKISHVSPHVVTKVVKAIEESFGTMTVTRGTKHTFLGMDIEFNNDGTVSMVMNSYIIEAVNDFAEDVSSPAATPCGKGLFNIDPASEALATEKAELFHSIVAKLLYISSRARSDISPTIAFLCTRVASPTMQDWLKLKRLLRYLQATTHLTTTLGGDDLTTLRTWVDASYAVHDDMKSHTGGCASFGRGVFMTKSTKQKLNTKSSTEAELVGASDYLPNTIWATHFIESQGRAVEDSIFYQDNQSAIRLENNGRASAGQKSRHINIRYFFIKDRIASGGLRVVHCPTSVMLADFYTKPLQGALFNRFRRVILGYDHISSLEKEYITSPDEERVGEGRPGTEQEEQAGESSDENEWTVVSRRGGASAKGGAAKDHGISHSSDSTYKGTGNNETGQSNESREKYGKPRDAHTLKIIPS
jgi:Reverse transcriptase (RNA-dependent DNA polymerase)